jgi:hypothetical protein
MRITGRRFVTRRCAVCEWTGAAVEIGETTGECPWCHAPAHVVREEFLFNAEEVRRQAAAFGRAGGLKGGRARAERLTSKERSEIARKAAATRWRRR